MSPTKTNLPLKDVIGLPLQSCIKAQTKVGNALFGYIRQTGFNPSYQYIGLMRMAYVSFVYEQDGLKRSIKIPLLTLVPIKPLLIDQVLLNYTLNIGQNAEGKICADFGNKTGNGWGYSEATRYSNQMGMDVKLLRRDIPLGLKKVLEFAVNKGIHSKPFSPSDYRPYDKNHVLGICGILDSIHNKKVNDLIAILDGIHKDIEIWGNKSPEYTRYAKVRQVPIEKRVIMPYTSIVQNKHLVYTDCCRCADMEKVKDFAALTSNITKIYDYIDGEDLIQAESTTNNLELMISAFGVSNCGEDYNSLTQIKRILSELELRGVANTNIVKKDNAAYTLLIENTKYYVELCDPISGSASEQTQSDTVKSSISGAKDRFASRRPTIHYIPITFKNVLVLKNPRLVKNRIASKLKKCSKQYQARKCDVFILNKWEANLFLNAYHPDMTTSADCFLGLSYKGKLLEVMAISKNDEHGSYRIDRIASRYMSHVCGGASKLLKYFMRNHTWRSIIVYAEKYSDSLYTKLGFTQVESYDAGTNDSLNTLYKYELTPKNHMPAK